MHPPGIQIYLRPCVTLTFDLLTPKLIVSSRASQTICANWRQNRFIRFQNITFTSLLIDKQTDRLRTVWPGGRRKLSHCYLTNCLYAIFSKILHTERFAIADTTFKITHNRQYWRYLTRLHMISCLQLFLCIGLLLK